MKRTAPRLRRGDPVWLEGQSRRRARAYPELRGHLEVDVAIVGGGMTGTVIARTFAGDGVSVCVLEADLVGRGSTAASSALLLQEPDQGLRELAAWHGDAASTRIWQLGREAVRDLTTTLVRDRIRCDLVQRDTIYFAVRAGHGRDLRAELRRRAKAGFDGDWLNAAELRQLTNLCGDGAIRTRGNAQFNPYEACLGLVRAAVASGARVCERSRVTRIERRGNGVRVHTRRGRLDASRVIVATGYATPQFRPLAGRFRMYRTYVAATEPLSTAERSALGLGDLMIWDTERPYHYARWTVDHRLLLGGGDRPVHGGLGPDARLRRAIAGLRRHFQSVLPPLADVETEHAWEGLFALTPDSLPFIGPHARYPRHLFALGYGGNGMTFAPLAARILLEQWRGVRSRDHELFAFGRFR